MPYSLRSKYIHTHRHAPLTTCCFFHKISRRSKSKRSLCELFTQARYEDAKGPSQSPCRLLMPEQASSQSCWQWCCVELSSTQNGNCCDTKSRLICRLSQGQQPMTDSKWLGHHEASQSPALTPCFRATSRAYFNLFENHRGTPNRDGFQRPWSQTQRLARRASWPSSSIRTSPCWMASCLRVQI